MSYFSILASIASLLIVCAACVIHLSQHIDRHSSHCERWGFVLTAAGAFGQIWTYFSARVESFPVDTLMHVGMAFIALSLIRGRLRAFMGRLPGFQWTDRRQQ